MRITLHDRLDGINTFGTAGRIPRDGSFLGFRRLRRAGRDGYFRDGCLSGPIGAALDGTESPVSATSSASDGQHHSFGRFRHRRLDGSRFGNSGNGVTPPDESVVGARRMVLDSASGVVSEPTARFPFPAAVEAAPAGVASDSGFRLKDADPFLHHFNHALFDESLVIVAVADGGRRHAIAHPAAGFAHFSRSSGLESALLILPQDVAVVGARVDVEHQIVEHRLDLLVEELVTSSAIRCVISAIAPGVSQLTVHCVTKQRAQIKDTQEENQGILVAADGSNFACGHVHHVIHPPLESIQPMGHHFTLHSLQSIFFLLISSSGLFFHN